MIAGWPLAPDGARVLAALLQMHGDSTALAPSLRACLPTLTEPVGPLTQACARRRLAGPKPPGRGRAPAARFVRRQARRWRIAQTQLKPPSALWCTRLGQKKAHLHPTVDRETVGRWIHLWAQTAPGARRDLLAWLPSAQAHWIGHAPPLTEDDARRALQ